MKQFRFNVTETVAIDKVYTVEAETEAEARVKAEFGDTLDEEELKIQGVVNREVTESLGKVKAANKKRPT